ELRATGLIVLGDHGVGKAAQHAQLVGGEQRVAGVVTARGKVPKRDGSSTDPPDKLATRQRWHCPDGNPRGLRDAARGRELAGVAVFEADRAHHELAVDRRLLARGEEGRAQDRVANVAAGQLELAAELAKVDV